MKIGRKYLHTKKISIKIYNNKHIISTFTNKNITKHWIIYVNFINDFMKKKKNYIKIKYLYSIYNEL